MEALFLAMKLTIHMELSIDSNNNVISLEERPKILKQIMQFQIIFL